MRISPVGRLRHRAHLASLAVALIALACRDTGAVSEAERRQIATEVEQRLREAYDLSRPNALERMLDLYPSGGRIVSASGGTVSVDRDTLEGGIRYFWENVGVNMRDPQWVWERFYVDVLSPTSAVATATYRIPHRNPRGEPHVLGGAITALFAKRDGRWVIIQEHLSDLPQTGLSSDTTAAHSGH